MFNTPQDVAVLQSIDAERFTIYYTPKEWLVHSDTIDSSPYGEPSTAVIGSDGVTSIPATRQLVSATGNFIVNGVAVNDVIEITDPDKGDFGRYKIVTVTDATTLVVHKNWPIGSLTSVAYKVLMKNERYSLFKTLLPFRVQISPTEDDLKKWGIEQKANPVDAVFELSLHLCTLLGVVPKVGDRFNYNYLDVVNEEIERQYEVLSLVERDQINDSGIPLHLVGTAAKTREIYT